MRHRHSSAARPPRDVMLRLRLSVAAAAVLLLGAALATGAQSARAHTPNVPRPDFSGSRSSDFFDTAAARERGGSNHITRMRLDSTVLVYEQGRVTMRVSCLAVTVAPCRGVVRIREQRQGARGALLADDTFTAAPGAITRIRVRPTATGRALFRKRTKLCTVPFVLADQGTIVQGYLPLVTPRRSGPARTAAGGCFEQRV